MIDMAGKKNKKKKDNPQILLAIEEF